MDKNLSQRVFAPGHRVDAVIQEPAPQSGDLVNGFVGGIHGSISVGGRYKCLIILSQPDHRRGKSLASTRRVDVIDLVSIGDGFDAILNDGDEVLVVNLFFLVSQLGKEEVGPLQFLLTQLVPQLFVLLAQGVPPTVLSHHQRAADDSHGLGSHDFVGESMFQHSILMDPCFVSEGILSHHCLVGLNEGSGEVGYQPAGTVNLLGDDIGMVGEQILSCPQCHDDLFKGGIAGTLTDSVDGTFNLPASAFDTRQRVGYSQS